MSEEEKLNLNNEQSKIATNGSNENGQRPLKRRKKKKRLKKKKNFLGVFVLLLLIIAIVCGAVFAIKSLTNKPVVDSEYKKALLVGLGQQNGDIKKLDSIVGEEEFKLIIEKYNNSPKAYQIDEKVKGDKKLVENLTHRINLVTTTNTSVGSISVENLLTQAANYADKVKAKNPKEKYPYVIALTDYARIDQDKTALKTIYANPDKYKNLKVVLGVQFWSDMEAGTIPSLKNKAYLELSAYCINPFDKAFNTLYYKSYPFADVMKFVQTQKYGLVGLSNPVLSYKEGMMIDGKGIQDWNNEFIGYYTAQAKKTPLFIDTYTQSIVLDKWYQEQTKKVIKEADKKGIKKIGGTKLTSQDIFNY